MHPTHPLFLLAAAATFAATAPCQVVLRSLVGDQPGANFGRAIAAVADVDGDGRADLVVGEPNRDFGTVQDAGSACLVSSRTAAILFRTYGTQIGGHLGGAVAGLDDMTGDGVPEWACGAPDPLLGIGSVRILSGASGLQVHAITGEPMARFGAAICSVGDRNNDGRSDFVVGSPLATAQTPASAVRLYSGMTGGLLGILGAAGNNGFGSSLALVGDLTGDGVPELAIGAPGDDSNGLDAGSVLARDYQNQQFAWLASGSFGAGQNGGGQVAKLGDLDGDGKSEILATTSANMIVGLSGATGGVLFVVQNAEFGASPSLAGIGDWNADGDLDFAVGSGSADFGNGRVWIYTTAPGRALLATIYGTSASGLGTAIAALGDLDGDGRAELAVGSPTYVDNGIVVGRVTIHSCRVTEVRTPIGIPCGAGAPAPYLTLAGSATLGHSLVININQVAQGNLGILWFGWSDTVYGGIPLPASLQAYGSPCSIYAAVDASVAFVPGNTPAYGYVMPIPPSSTFTGLQFFVQAAQLNPMTTGGFTFTQGGRIRIGN